MLRLNELFLQRGGGGGSCCWVSSRAQSPQSGCSSRVTCCLGKPVPARGLGQVCSNTCVLCVASSAFGLFKFTVKCADDTDSCSFGARFESWGLSLGPNRRWVQFRHTGSDVEACDESSMTGALCKNISRTFMVEGGCALLQAPALLQLVLPVFACLTCHHHRVAGHKTADFLAPQSPIFFSHAWGDGTARFVGHLKEGIEEQTLVNVWVDMLGIDQVMSLVCCAVLCARVG